MGICTKLMKGFLIFSGFCYMMSAAALLYIGIWVFSTYDHYDEIADSEITLVPATIIIATSVFMCIVGVLAVVVAFKHHKKLLAVFFCLILMIFLGEVAASLFGYYYRSVVNEVLDSNLKDALNKYNVTGYKEQIDYMQSEFQCCGVKNATDWMDSTYWRLNHTDTVPTSCCKEGNFTCVPNIKSGTINHEGCLSKLKEEFGTNLLYITVAVVSIGSMQMVAMLSTCILICRTREERYYNTLEEVASGGLTV